MRHIQNCWYFIGNWFGPWKIAKQIDKKQKQTNQLSKNRNKTSTTISPVISTDSQGSTLRRRQQKKNRNREGVVENARCDAKKKRSAAVQHGRSASNFRRVPNNRSIIRTGATEIERTVSAARPTFCRRPGGKIDGETDGGGPPLGGPGPGGRLTRKINSPSYRSACSASLAL